MTSKSQKIISQILLHIQIDNKKLNDIITHMGI